MDNVDGFSWDVLSKVRVKTEVRDYETDAPSTRERVKFIEGNDYDDNWDYFEYKNEGGFITIEQYPDSQEIVVYTSFEASNDSYTLQDISTTPSDYFNIRDQIVDNHGDTILSIVPEFEGLEINILPSDDIVVSNAAGDILYSGWFHSDDQPREDGRLYWNVTMHPAEQWDDWVLSVGGLNQVQEVTNADNTVDYLLESGGSNATFVTEYYYRDDMSPEAWSQMLVSHQSVNVPDGTFDDAVAIGVQTWAGDNDGDGSYDETMQVVRFAPARDNEPDRVDWDWDTNVRIEYRVESTTVKNGGNDVYSIELNTFDLVDASAADIAKFDATIQAQDTQTLTDAIATGSLKLSPTGKMYLVNNSSQELFAEVTDYETWYQFTNPETGSFMAWFWNESAAESDDGNSHVGYALGIDMETLTDTEIASLKTTFPPASDAYTADQIFDLRLVHWERTDANGNVIHDWYHLQHFDSSYNVLGQVGYDVENNLYITNVGDRIEVGDMPTSNAAADAADVAAAKTLFDDTVEHITTYEETPATSAPPSTDPVPSGIPVYTLDGTENVTAASDTSTALVGSYAIESYDNNGTPVIEATSVVPNSDNTGWEVNISEPNPIPLTPISDLAVLGNSVGTLSFSSGSGSGGSTGNTNGGLPIYFLDIDDISSAITEPS
ncbi:MAG: hypothetical protein VXY53_06525, partial [Candidatus Thermoplasmatota archaeon]|nr:hypothetical protein [Candidatus Thermoplasmatota archaeon]